MDTRSVEYCGMRINPFMDVKAWEMIGKDDMLIIFKDGSKYVYDMFNHTHRRIWYENINDLSDDEWNFEFRMRLLQIMNRNFISQKELASQVGISEVMISRYINGHCIPSARILDKIINVLNSSYDELFYFKRF